MLTNTGINQRLVSIMKHQGKIQLRWSRSFKRWYIHEATPFHLLVKAVHLRNELNRLNHK